MGRSPEVQSNLQLRRARPGDAPFLAWAILSASRGHLSRGTWDFIWGFEEDELLEFLEYLVLSETPHWCHHSRFLVAETGAGEPIAALSAFAPEIDGPQALGPVALQAATDFGLSGAELLESFGNANAVRDAVPAYRPDVWAIENVACLPEYRGVGIVGRLLQRAKSEGLARGFTKLQANVFSDNVVAQQAYRKSGFELDEELTSSVLKEQLGTQGMQRFLLAVN
ncbi:MAG: GNAT family N-acetyltransferase [Longimicrobiales bacterium]